jgi:AcrR family transcriptional regulator
LGIAERKEREKLQRRQEIISAAESVFFSQGYENSTMDDVAKKVELSKGTLYLYFNSKEELLLVIVKKAFIKLYELFEEHTEKENDGLCKIRATGEAFIRFFFEYEDYYNIIKYHHNQPGFFKQDCEICEEIKKLKLTNHNFMVEILEGGIQDGSIRKNLDPSMTALLLWGESMGVLQMVSSASNYIKNYFSIEKDELVNYFFEFTYNALKA